MHTNTPTDTCTLTHTHIEPQTDIYSETGPYTDSQTWSTHTDTQTKIYTDTGSHTDTHWELTLTNHTDIYSLMQLYLHWLALTMTGLIFRIFIIE